MDGVHIGQAGRACFRPDYGFWCCVKASLVVAIRGDGGLPQVDLVPLILERGQYNALYQKIYFKLEKNDSLLQSWWSTAIFTDVCCSSQCI